MDLESGQRFLHYVSMSTVGALSLDIRSQSLSNCLVTGSVAALICQATSFDVMGKLELAAALPTSSTSGLPELWVSSLVKLLFTSSVFGMLISHSQNLDVKLIVETVYVLLQYRLTYFTEEIHQSYEFKKSWLSNGPARKLAKVTTNCPIWKSVLPWV